MAEHIVSADGESVRVSPGDELVVRIPEPATSGYSWGVSGMPDGVEFLSSELAAHGSAPGASGERTIRFAVRSAAEGRVTLSLTRPWESDAVPAGSFSCSVEPG